MQRAIGEKYGQIVFNVSMSISAVLLGIAKGWSLALAMLAMNAPLYTLGLYLMSKALDKRSKVQACAYSEGASCAH